MGGVNIKTEVSGAKDIIRVEHLGVFPEIMVEEAKQLVQLHEKRAEGLLALAGPLKEYRKTFVRALCSSSEKTKHRRKLDAGRVAMRTHGRETYSEYCTAMHNVSEFRYTGKIIAMRQSGMLELMLHKNFDELYSLMVLLRKQSGGDFEGRKNPDMERLYRKFNLNIVGDQYLLEVLAKQLQLLSKSR